ncbi:MAG: hypothetical protein LBU34_05980 [Planctomycetaceae bacterium]|jgi:hypothetical protein|nr:hypothetical protein [Planctomycetaceae bacterium]
MLTRTHSAGNTKYGSFLLRYKFDGESEWKTPVSTKLRHTLIFTEEEVGKRIIMQAAWVNTRMLPGHWSDEVWEIIN